MSFLFDFVSTKFHKARATNFSLPQVSGEDVMLLFMLIKILHDKTGNTRLSGW